MDLKPDKARRSHRSEKGSLITAIVLGLLFVGWVGEWPVELDPDMYYGAWRSPFVVFGPLFVPVPGVHLFPWQILLLGVVPFCLGASGTARQHAREMDRAMLLSIVCIAVTFLWGWVSGGSPYFAYYQVWRFLAALLIAYILMSSVRTQADLANLGKIVILAGLIRATLCIYFFCTHVYGGQHPDWIYVTDHDDSMLFVVALLIVSIWAFLKGGRTPWTLAALGVPVLLSAMVLNNRRLAWVELGWAMLVIYLLIGPGPLRSRINRGLMIAAPVLLIYVAVGLGSDSAVFAPVHAFTTTGSNADASSLARKEEIRNLLRTLADTGNPIFGTGWGQPYDKVESVYANFDPTWTLYLYTPHNSLLALAAYAGLVGIVGIWGVVPMAAYLAARGYRSATDPVSRTAGIVAICSLAVYSAHCYGDIGFESLVGALILGAALGTAGKLAVWSEALPSAQTAPARGGGEHPKFRLRPRYRKAGETGNRPVPSSQRPGPLGGNDVITRPSRAPRRRSTSWRS